MSHIAEVKTEIRSLEIAIQTLEQLGIPVHREPFTLGVYGQADYERQCAAGFFVRPGVAHHAGKTFGFGFEPQPGGSFQIVGDPYCIAYCADDPGEQGKKYAYSAENKGHARFLQAYAENVGWVLAASYGMNGERIEDAGDVLLILRGGMLLAHEEMHIRCISNGACEVSMHGCVDSSCYQRTADFEAALGRTLADTRHLDLAHDSAGSHLARVAQ